MDHDGRSRTARQRVLVGGRQSVQTQRHPQQNQQLRQEDDDGRLPQWQRPQLQLFAN